MFTFKGEKLDSAICRESTLEVWQTVKGTAILRQQPSWDEEQHSQQVSTNLCLQTSILHKDQAEY